MTWLIVPFFGGLADSLPCDPCGAFPFALHRGDRSVRRQLLYNLGLLNTLALIGAASGTAAAVVGCRPFRLGAQWLALALAMILSIVAVVAKCETPGGARPGITIQPGGEGRP